jgi:hypothetical protein
MGFLASYSLDAGSIRFILIFKHLYKKSELEENTTRIFYQF